MNQTLIKDINIWTMDERDSRFFGWVLLENGKIASMGEGEPPAMPDTVLLHRRFTLRRARHNSAAQIVSAL